MSGKVLLCAVFFAVLSFSFASPAQTDSVAPQPIAIDASSPTPPPGPANYQYDPADAKSPSGQVLGLNARYLTLNGKPWLPVMGEFHYSRVPEAEWETEILKMKSAGVQIISTYIIWIHHEEVEGEWDWSGQRDLRRFVELCAKHGMYVVPRIGPWSHAEVRNGGFPDWLLTKTTQLRSNDPTYLHYVDLYYRQIAAQLKGLMWSQGGPVIAIQLENEYRGRPPDRGAPHILKLKELARSAGLCVPFYTVTGWDGASIPAGAVLPVYGGYPDAPWDASINKLPPSEVYNFRFGSRVTGDMGAIGASGQPTGNAANFTLDTPFMTAEMGGGMQVTYHRRPVVSADDIVSMMPVMLGSGVNLYGSYMFHGGENPDGKLTTLQESLATHYANDLPQKTYDFEAFIGEFGDERASLLKEKSWNYFLNDFGSMLAPMEPHAPDVLPANARDLSVPRLSVRTHGPSGFLFVNNHVRDYSMPARPGFQVAIKLLGDRTLAIPARPITLPADAYFVWPFNLDLAGLKLRYATAQPLAILGTPDSPIYTFFAQPGIQPEFAVEDVPGLKLLVSHGPAGTATSRHDGALVFTLPLNDPNGTAVFTLPDGKTITLIVMPRQDAEHAWKVALGDQTGLLVTAQQVVVDRDTVTLQSLASKNFSARLIPGDHLQLISEDPHTTVIRANTVYFTAPQRPAQPLLLDATQTQPAEAPAPLPADFKPSSRPRVVAAAPTEADWARAATWTIPLPKSALDTAGATERHFLRIHYSGDVARLSVSSDDTSHLLDDNFYDGQAWLVGLTRFAPQIEQAGDKVQFSIYPLRKDPPIFFEPGVDPKPGATLDSVELLTQYALKLKLEPLGTKQP